jgi:hypothetical protein
MKEFYTHHGITKLAMMEKSAIIVRDSAGFSVLSKEGKRIGGAYKTKQEAEKRLREIEYFKNKEASFVDTITHGYQALSNFKPLTNATQQFFRDGGMNYLKAKSMPMINKIHNKMGFNNQIKMNYAKLRGTELFNKYQPVIKKTEDRIDKLIPSPIRNTMGTMKTISRGLTNVGKI